jgi:hypothetical protein
LSFVVLLVRFKVQRFYQITLSERTGHFRSKLRSEDLIASEKFKQF